MQIVTEKLKKYLLTDDSMKTVVDMSSVFQLDTAGG
jgi:anti-anti-sigma regulatory factor